MPAFLLKAGVSDEESKGVSRRRFISTSVTGLAGAALLGGCDTEGGAPTSAGDGAVDRRHGRARSRRTTVPRSRSLKFGMIALTDCSPIVIAHEKGFFKKYGINLGR
jgi:nitrate/nitrite transport system substrate-binding protein